ncbi:hypothetical protein EA658_13795 [Pseudoxanthomonas winnipegensis]|jgi:hypothetical protein|uniref:Uncharacterized protein n=1 Tax=Pseudoxanthomonas winnipegensis TaxID=2480810 RepID=A0ABY1WB57_9GAMM|nr:hypothetical protein [Pseudoxanthomonas winnipegensis]TAA18215.1 hypothetical protein EA658_13795 [Pseudoxanthomonas winnipegensis]
MPDPHSLKKLLQAWATAYGGEQFARFGYAADDRLAGAALTTGDAEVDRIEQIVQRLERVGRWKEARVLRAEFFLPDLPENDRLQRLKRIGLTISRAGYYIYLNAACAYVEGALGEQP